MGRTPSPPTDGRTRQLLVWGGAIVVIVAALVGVALLGRDDGGDASDVRPVEPYGVVERGTVMGRASTKPLLVEFVDLQCPICAHSSNDVVPRIVSDLVAPGTIRFEILPLRFLGADSDVAAKAALGAAEQHRYFEWMATFYANQGEENSGYVTEAFLDAVSEAAGVDGPRARRYGAGPGTERRLGEIAARTNAVGVDGTPTYVLLPNGTFDDEAVVLNQRRSGDHDYVAEITRLLR